LNIDIVQMMDVRVQEINKSTLHQTTLDNAASDSNENAAKDEDSSVPHTK